MKGDTADEDNETITVTLGTLTNATLPSTDGAGAASGTITDDDATLVTAANVTVAEGAGNATLTLSIVRPSSETRAVSGTVTPSFTAGAGKAEAADLTSAAAVGFTIAADASSTTVNIPITQDDVIEGNESFTAEIAVTAPTEAPAIEGGTAPTITITDDDAGTLALNISRSSVVEGGSFSLEVSLSHTADQTTTDKTLPADLSLTVTPVFATAAVGKAASADMTDAVAKAVTLTAGSSSATASFAIADDDADEPDEALTFRLALAQGETRPDGVTLGTDTVDATIEDGDATLVTAANVTVAEGAGNATLTLSIVRPSGETRAVSGTVTPAFTTGAGKAEAADLGSTNAVSFAIAADASSTTVNIPITQDDVIEGNESFTAEIAVTAPTEAPAIEGGTAPTITITDDDAGTLSLVLDTASVSEGGSFSLGVRLSHTADQTTTDKTLPADLSLTVTPVFATAAVGKAASADMTDAVAKAVTLTAGSSSATASFAIADDDADEPDEALTFTLALAQGETQPDGVTLGTDTVDATIADGDATLVTAANVTVAEGRGQCHADALDRPPVGRDAGGVGHRHPRLHHRRREGRGRRPDQHRRRQLRHRGRREQHHGEHPDHAGRRDRGQRELHRRDRGDRAHRGARHRGRHGADHHHHRRRLPGRWHSTSPGRVWWRAAASRSRSASPTPPTKPPRTRPCRRTCRSP